MENLLVVNEGAIDVYFAVRHQQVVVGDKITGLDVTAIKSVMDIYGVKDKKGCLEKVLYLYANIGE